jgi:four helix bundle protein
MRDENGESPRRIERFEDLVAWQKARVLVSEVMQLCDKPPIDRRFGYRDQIQRAAISIMSNIAEGYERGGKAEFFHFLSIAKGSAAEVRSLLYVALDAAYVDQPTFIRMDNLAQDVSRLVGGLRAATGRMRDAERARH